MEATSLRVHEKREYGRKEGGSTPSVGQTQETDELASRAFPAAQGMRVLPHKSLGLRTRLLRRGTSQALNIKRQVWCLGSMSAHSYSREEEESMTNTDPGAEGLQGGARGERVAARRELLEAAEHQGNIQTARPSPSAPATAPRQNGKPHVLRFEAAGADSGMNRGGCDHLGKDHTCLGNRGSRSLKNLGGQQSPAPGLITTLRS